MPASSLERAAATKALLDVVPIGDLVLLLEPGIQDAQHLVAGGRGRRRPTLEQVAEERL